MKKFIFIPIVLIALYARSQSTDESNIRGILNAQTKSWNSGNLEEFMQGYWKNDSLMFIGKSGINWGWQKTLDHYKSAYPDTATMGKLSFDILLVKKLSDEYYYVVGKWALKRTIGDIGGIYNLLFRKIQGKWQIIADHSS